MTAIPTTMSAMILTGHGGLEMYEWRTDWPVPQPEPEEVLIKVGACGLNNTDVNTRSGWYSPAVTDATTGDDQLIENGEDPSWGGAPLTFPRIQGADAVGCVVAVGRNADPALLGERVMVDGWHRDWSDPTNVAKAGYFGSELDGGFAQYTKAHQRSVQRVNSTLSDAELATFQCSYTTAEGMLARANITRGDTVLIPGASGGVGSALVQLAKRHGARVIAMASESKHDQVARLGPDRILPRAPENLKSTLADETITIIADVVGGRYWSTLVDVLAPGGRYTVSGAIAGPMVDLDLRTLYLRDLTFTGSTFVPPNIFPDVVSYIERGEIQPLVAAIYPLSDLPTAQQAFIDKDHTGNIVVIP